MVKIGDTFLLTNRDIDSHLHIIISHPDQNPYQIVTVNFTSWKEGKDDSCIVDVHEHPFIRVKSCIDYRREKLISLEQYQAVLSRGDIRAQAPVEQNLLARILYGASISQFISFGNRQILMDQVLIEFE